MGVARTDDRIIIDAAREASNIAGHCLDGVREKGRTPPTLRAGYQMYISKPY
jgi:hypothetical protein